MTTAFVDFQDVWLAYNEELLASGQFAVENINLTVGEGEFIAIRESTATMSGKRLASVMEYIEAYCAMNEIRLSAPEDAWA